MNCLFCQREASWCPYRLSKGVECHLRTAMKLSFMRFLNELFVDRRYPGNQNRESFVHIVW